LAALFEDPLVAVDRAHRIAIVDGETISRHLTAEVAV
jgi:hypothetical protein